MKLPRHVVLVSILFAVDFLASTLYLMFTFGNKQATQRLEPHVSSRRRHNRSASAYDADLVDKSIAIFRSNFTTVISMYFNLSKSKHTNDEYRSWVRNMLLSVRAPLVMFVDRKTVEFCRKWRDSTYIYRTVYLIYEDVWEMLGQLEATRNRSYTHAYKQEQLDKDPESSIHSPELYALWNLKAFMVAKAAKLNPYWSSFFLYTDAGAWREAIMPGWPDDTFARQLASKLRDRMLFGQIGQVEEATQALPPASSAIFIQGTFFAGSLAAVERHQRLFYNLHDKLLDDGQFIGRYISLICDLTILIVYLLFLTYNM